MNKQLEIELCLWYKVFSDTRCSITCQGFLENGFEKRWGKEFLEFKKSVPKSSEERVRFRKECERKYGLKFHYVNGIPRYVDSEGNEY